MRFLGRSLMGIFLMSVTAGMLTWAGHLVYSAAETRLSKDGFRRETGERVFAVNVVTYRAQTATPVLTAFGQVRSRRILELRAPSAGKITELSERFVDGGRVTADEVILQVDRAEAEATLARVQTDLAEAEAERRNAERALVLAQEELAAAEDRLRLRQIALDRQLDLKARGVVTEAAIETAELTLSTSRQAVLSQRQALARAEARLTLGATGIARNRINLAEAEKGLADTTLRAAFSGTLGDVSVVKGGVVANNERIAILTDPDQLEVSFRISAAQYARLLDRNGSLLHSDVEIRLDVTGIELSATGQIIRESATVGEEQTGRLLFARLDAAPGFRPGDFVAVRIREPALDDVARLPATALDTRGNVLVIGADERLRNVQVEVLRRQEDDVLVRGAGLDGAEIVATRSPLLGEGIRVRPIRRGGQVGEGLIEISEDRRARLVAFVRASERLPEEKRAEMLAGLSGARVPREMVERLEARIGG